MTPEQAFEKWWDDHASRPHLSGRHTLYAAFLAGQQYQETNQLMVLTDIRKAVGDPEGRLMWEELVKRIEGLVSPWRDIESAPKDGTVFIAFEWHAAGGFQFMCTRSTDKRWIAMMDGSEREPILWMPQIPCDPKSVTTEKEEA